MAKARTDSPWRMWARDFALGHCYHKRGPRRRPARAKVVTPVMKALREKQRKRELVESFID